MTGVEDVVGSLSANADAAQEALAQVAAVRAVVEALEGRLQQMQLEGKAAAAGACRAQLVECAAMAAGLVDGLGQTRDAAAQLRGA